MQVVKNTAIRPILVSFGGVVWCQNGAGRRFLAWKTWGELMCVIGEIQRIAICFFRNASCEKYRNSADFGVVCVVFGVKMGPGVDFLHRKRGEMVIIHR
jgi:hypothetical protein